MGTETEREERFRLIYAGNFEPVLAYALRRVDQPADAADVVAEIFLVTWRRLREVPAGDDARLWLYRVSRRVLAIIIGAGRAGSGWRSGCGNG